MVQRVVVVHQEIAVYLVIRDLLGQLGAQGHPVQPGLLARLEQPDALDQRDQLAALGLLVLMVQP